AEAAAHEDETTARGASAIRIVIARIPSRAHPFTEMSSPTKALFIGLAAFAPFFSRGQTPGPEKNPASSSEQTNGRPGIVSRAFGPAPGTNASGTHTNFSSSDKQTNQSVLSRAFGPGVLPSEPSEEEKREALMASLSAAANVAKDEFLKTTASLRRIAAS